MLIRRLFGFVYMIMLKVIFGCQAVFCLRSYCSGPMLHQHRDSPTLEPYDLQLR